MNIQLIQGEFSPSDALDIITQMIHIKIKYHENKINRDSDEADIKSRENKIKNLQKELFEVRNFISSKNERVKIESIIKL